MTPAYALFKLQGARDYLAAKSFNGDQGGDYMNYWDWNSVTCAAIGIIDDTISQVYLEGL